MEHVGARRALQRRHLLRLIDIATSVRHVTAWRLIAVIVASAAIVLATAGCTSGRSSPAAGADATNVIRPDQTLTPGDLLPATRAEICSSGYSKRVRDVSSQTKREIYAEYGFATHTPGDYEVDHLVPLGIGGSNDKRNLWPEPINVRPGAKQKDDLENELHNRVCDGRIDLAQAQREIVADWYAAYLRYVPGR